MAVRQGDPGVFGFLRKAAGTVAGVAGSILPGPAGTIARQAGRIIRGPSQQQATSPRYPRASSSGFQGPSLPPMGQLPVPGGYDQGLGKGTHLPAEYGPQPKGFSQVLEDVTPVVGCPKGYKPNDTAYFEVVRTPGNPQGLVVYRHPGTKCRKYRRTNPANPRALNRSIARMKSAKRLGKQLSRFSIRDKKCR